MKKVIVISLALVFSLSLMLGTIWFISRPKTLIAADTVEVNYRGRIIAVYDRLSGKEYIFRRELVKRSEAAKAPRTAVNTSTIQIDTLPHGGFQIVSDGIMYRITQKGRG